MAIFIRDLQLPNDYEALAELLSIANQSAVTAVELEEEDRHIPTTSTTRLNDEGMLIGFNRERVVAVNDDGEILGHAVAWRAGFAPPGQIASLVAVRPVFRNQGVGEALLTHIESWARNLQASVLMSVVPDTLPQAKSFVLNRGFCVDRHLYNSTLCLNEGRDEAIDSSAERNLLQQGLRIVNAEQVLESYSLEQIYEFYTEMERDIPGILHVTQYDDWYKEFDKTPKTLILFALDGNDIIGVTHLSVIRESSGVYNFFTGVNRRFRGKGIAYALKVHAIRVAKENAFTFMQTDNDSENGPMLAVNRKLGFVPSPGGHYRVLKTMK